jgi:hypothetical protein
MYTMFRRLKVFVAAAVFTAGAVAGLAVASPARAADSGVTSPVEVSEAVLHGPYPDQATCEAWRRAVPAPTSACFRIGVFWGDWYFLIYT